MFSFVFLAAASSISVECIPVSLLRDWYSVKPEAIESFRARDPNSYLMARGDFDGDGGDDIALLLVRKTDNNAGVFACLSGTRRGLCDFVYTQEGGTGIEGLGVRVIRKADFPEVCAKYPRCRNLFREWAVTTDVLVVFSEEKADIMYLWDSPTKSFQRYWLSE